MYNKGSQCEDTDDEGGHYVVEGVKLCLAAQDQCVLDVGERLQNLEKVISEKTYSLSIFHVHS